MCGLIDYHRLVDNLDRRCSAANDPLETMCDRMMFATDATYGREGSVEEAERLAGFMVEFFQIVGRTYTWGTKADAVMNGTASAVMAYVNQVGAQPGPQTHQRPTRK